MKKIIVSSFVVLSFYYVSAQTKPKVIAKPTPSVAVNSFKNLSDSFSYAVGVNIATNMKSQGINNLNTVLLKKAFDDIYGGKQSAIPPDKINGIFQKNMQIISEKNSTKEIESGRAFLNNNKKVAGVVTLPDGLQYQIIKKSDSGILKPKATDTVVVNYIGSLVNGVVFESSYKNGTPATFPVNQVIKGWTEILQLMTVGDKWKVFIPTEMAYYLNPRDPKVIPPGAALIFEISLEQIKPSANK